MQLLSHVSDETLFNNMALGDVFAHDVLFDRYVRIGRQIAGMLIRVNGLVGMTDQDFITVIEDSVEKAFRYYNTSGIRFYVYCKEILNQNLSNAVMEILNNKEHTRGAIELDSPVNEKSSLTYHEIVADKHKLSSSNEYDLSRFLNVLSSPENPEIKNAAKVLLLSEMGYTINEIICKTRLSQYFVRKILSKYNK